MNTHQHSLFNLTHRVIQEAERKTLTFRSVGVIPDQIMRTIMFPFPFFQLGMAELFRPASKWAFISFALLVAASFLIPYAEVSAETKSYILLACIYLPLFLVVFAVPSTFAFDSIKAAQIQSLADHIYSLGIDSDEKIKALEENFSNIAERTYARTKALQWIVATVWALFLYGFNQVNNIVLKIAPERITKIVSDNFATFAIYGVVSLLSVLVIVGYKKGNDAVFRRIQFALQELKYRIAITQPTTADHPTIPLTPVHKTAQSL